MNEWILAMGIPSALFSLAVWWFKKQIDKQEKRQEEREKNTEQLMQMIMASSRANYILTEATARAVQRIPDAHCNGDMKRALEEATAIQQKEHQFLIDQGVKHIFGD